MSEHDDGAPVAEGTDRAPAGGRYRFVRRLSADDDRPVWEAVDEWSGDPALLVHVPTPEDDADGAAAIRRTVGQEVRAAGTLTHPHVSPVLDAVSDGSAGLWVAGGTRPGLTLLAAAPGVGEPDRVARWGRELAEGLAALHAAGLVHRDPRPGMVGVDSSGRAVLLGVAATADRGAGAAAPDGDDGPGTRREDLRVLAQTLRTVAEPVAEGHEPSPGLRATLEYAAGQAPATAEEFREALAVLDSGRGGSGGGPSGGSGVDSGSPGGSDSAHGSAAGAGAGGAAAAVAGSGAGGFPSGGDDRSGGATPSGGPDSGSNRDSGGGSDSGSNRGSGGGSGSGSGSGAGSVAAGAAGVAGVAAAGAGAAALSGGTGNEAGPGGGAASGGARPGGGGAGTGSDGGPGGGAGGGSGPGSDSETTTVRRPPAASEEPTRTVTPAPSDPTLQQGRPEGGSGEGQWSGAPASPWSPGERRPSSIPTAASNTPRSPWAEGGAGSSSPPWQGQQQSPPSSPYGGPPYGAAPYGAAPYGSQYGQGAPQQGSPWSAPPPASAPPERRGWVARHRTLAVVTAIVLAVVLIGGAATAGVLLSRGGEDTPAAAPPVAAPGPALSPVTPVGPVGDPQTADPCSLLSVSSFMRFGTPKLYDDFGSLSACEVDVTTADGGTVRTFADFYARGELIPPSVTERVGDVGVTRYPATDGRCRRALSLSDGTVVDIRSVNGSQAPNPPVDLCATADVGVSTATPILVAHAVARRAPGAGTSLNGIEGCSLLDPTAVGQLPGVDVAKQVRLFGGWGCSVGFDAAFQNTAYASVLFYRDATLPGTPTRIGRHTAIETPTPAQDGNPPSCEIDIAQRSYTGSSGVARVDTVQVRYVGAGPPTDPPDLCAALRPVAADVERRLPPPS